MRLVKPDVMLQIQLAVLGCPRIVDPLANAAEICALRGETGSRGAFGEPYDRQPGPFNLKDPLTVIPTTLENPYLMYLVDKFSEGVARSHQTWQVAQRTHDNKLPFDFPEDVPTWFMTLPM